MFYVFRILYTWPNFVLTRDLRILESFLILYMVYSTDYEQKSLLKSTRSNRMYHKKYRLLYSIMFGQVEC